MQVHQIQSIEQVAKQEWNALAGTDYPFMRYEFLLALEESGAVRPETGWQAAHLLLKNNTELVACMPLYFKSHSWGEYVFDQQWAQSYSHYGLEYYPKALSAIPFTPCQGQRIAIKEGYTLQTILPVFLTFIQEQAELANVSSWHCLFPDNTQLEILKTIGLNIREGVQFQWFNQNYRDFDDYLQNLTASKRKMIKRERRKIKEQGIVLQQFPGISVTQSQWEQFYDFYEMTYLKKGHPPYLSLNFFLQLAESMPEQLLLVMALKDQKYVAAALSFVGNQTLYGRYWGCYDEYNALHFETCYYQGLEFCIAQQLQKFDSGAQGEHKISRGFQPISTYSAHWLKDPRFGKAIADFLRREKVVIQQYKQDAAQGLPFKQVL